MVRIGAPFRGAFFVKNCALPRRKYGVKWVENSFCMCIACADNLRGIFSFPALPAAQIGCSLRILAMSERLKGHLFILATNTIFGVFIPVSKYLLNGYVSPMMLTCFRIVGATFLFWTASFFISDNKVTWKALLWFLFFALTGIVFRGFLFLACATHRLWTRRLY